MLHHYRALIQLRHTEPVVAHGDFTMLLPEHEQVYAFIRKLAEVELLVLANLSGRTAMADQIPDAGSWEGADLLIGTGPAPDPAHHRLSLQPWEARVYRRTVAGAG